MRRTSYHVYGHSKGYATVLWTHKTGTTWGLVPSLLERLSSQEEVRATARARARARGRGREEERKRGREQERKRGREEERRRGGEEERKRGREEEKKRGEIGDDRGVDSEGGARGEERGGKVVDGVSRRVLITDSQQACIS